ncbi:MAG TPA: hypothetical protein VJZ27_10625, partial [Aggregatilineales bacterium]|nr:hypothetical protein [Aggregatilineales bacterium]
HLPHPVTRKRGEEALCDSEKVAQEFQERLRALHEIGLQLSTIETIDEFYYHAVELGTRRPGIERCGLMLIDDDNYLIGTYGTDESGGIRREENLKIQLAEESRELQPVKEIINDAPFRRILKMDFGVDVLMSCAGTF